MTWVLLVVSAIAAASENARAVVAYGIENHPGSWHQELLGSFDIAQEGFRGGGVLRVGPFVPEATVQVRAGYGPAEGLDGLSFGAYGQLFFADEITRLLGAWVRLQGTVPVFRRDPGMLAYTAGAQGGFGATSPGNELTTDFAFDLQLRLWPWETLGFELGSHAALGPEVVSDLYLGVAWRPRR